MENRKKKHKTAIAESYCLINLPCCRVWFADCYWNLRTNWACYLLTAAMWVINADEYSI